MGSDIDAEGRTTEKALTNQLAKEIFLTSNVDNVLNGDGSKPNVERESKIKKKAELSCNSEISSKSEDDGDDDECSTSHNEKKVCTPSLYTCNFSGCGKSFGRLARLSQHNSVHTGERLFQCSYEGCTKSYTRFFHLRRHKQNSHVSESYIRMLSCPVKDCSRQLKSKDTLKKHYHRFHERSGKFKCEQCDETFRKHSLLKSHVFQHTGVYPFVCSCGAGFLSQRDLKRHEPRHDSKYKCPFKGCEENFTRWTQLRTHTKLVHPREYKCAECGHIFWSKGNLRYHVQIHSEQRKVFRCSWNGCTRFYHYEKNLRQHVRYYHERKMFVCTKPDCAKELSSKRKLLNHLQLHDPLRELRRPQKPRPPRKRRKDADKPKKSMAGKLSGVVLDHNKEKLLCNTENAEIEMRSSVDESEVVEDVLNITCEKDKDRKNLEVQIKEECVSDSCSEENESSDEKGDVNIMSGSGVESESHFMDIDWPSRIQPDSTESGKDSDCKVEPDQL